MFEIKIEKLSPCFAKLIQFEPKLMVVKLLTIIKIFPSSYQKQNEGNTCTVISNARSLHPTKTLINAFIPLCILIGNLLFLNTEWSSDYKAFFLRLQP